MSIFQLSSNFEPTADQPQAINKLVAGLRADIKHQVLLGITGSGKTFTMAGVIEKMQQPTLVISPNKTLAAQLYQEFKTFFPNNAVHYFISYYDYYQPEAYIPHTDTYIEKDAKINETIDQLRHATVADLLTRRDVIVVASVSCIYGIGEPEEYQKISLELKAGQKISREALLKNLVTLQYSRNEIDPQASQFSVRGNDITIIPPTAAEKIFIKIVNNKIKTIENSKNKPNAPYSMLPAVRIWPAKFFVTEEVSLKIAMRNIQTELQERIEFFKKNDKLVEAQRIEQRAKNDLNLMKTTGYCPGIENYSRHLAFRVPGQPPATLMDYFPKNSLLFIDESHLTISQVRAMAVGDRQRKEALVEYGFRLPSAIDNRPLTFKEFTQKQNNTIYVSATPALYERLAAQNDIVKKNFSYDSSEKYVVEQLIRPTYIPDPKIEIRPAKNQVKDLVQELRVQSTKNERTLVLALTKRLSEELADYLREQGLKSLHLHSEIRPLERPEYLKKLRTGEIEILVGINLLREGLDLPEVSLVAILDADKEGFLRNPTTLIQIVGRAARHPNARVIMYASRISDSMRQAIDETERRRKAQIEYNKERNIIPKPIIKPIVNPMAEFHTNNQKHGAWNMEQIISQSKNNKNLPYKTSEGKAGYKKYLEQELKKAVKNWDFEKAIQLRDEIKVLKY